jgi:hypothetical protein
MGVQLRSRLLDMLNCYGTSSLRNWAVVELSSRPYGSCKMAQLNIHESIIKLVQEIFPEHVILLRGEIPWSVLSPNLSVCDHFLWGYLKAKVYTDRPRTINDFEISIQEQISVAPENTVSRRLGNLWARLEEWVCNDGKHLSDVLFKTK